MTRSLTPPLLLAFSLALMIGCPSPDDDGRPDAGPAIVDAGPQDTDEDGHADASDNCPSTPNSSQDDADMDGVGDACDSCPFTPNSSDGLPALAQDGCFSLVEIEPNDAVGNGSSVSLPTDDTVVELLGLIEAPTGDGEQAVDRFRLELAEGPALYEIVVEPRRMSRIEPYLSLDHQDYGVTRIAEGTQRARRQLFFHAPGAYELLIADRRGMDDGAPTGGDEHEYVVRLRRQQRSPTPVMLPEGPFHETRSYRPRDGDVLLFQTEGNGFGQALYFEAVTGYGRGDSDVGPDLIFGATSTTGDWFTEFDNQSPSVLDPAINGLSEDLVIALDHRRIEERMGEIRIRFGANYFEEEEPNDPLTMAQDIAVPSELDSARIERAGDEDWYRFDLLEGRVILLTFNTPRSPTSRMDIEFGRVEGELFTPLKTWQTIGDDAGGEYVPIAIAGHYAMRVSGAQGHSIPEPCIRPMNCDYRFDLRPITFAEDIARVLSPPPFEVQTSTTVRLDGNAFSTRGLFIRADQASSLFIQLSSTANIQPRLSFFRSPALIEPIGSGTTTLSVNIQQSQEPYFLIVEDTEFRFLEDSEEKWFELEIQITPQ